MFRLFISNLFTHCQYENNFYQALSGSTEHRMQALYNVIILNYINGVIVCSGFLQYFNCFILGIRLVSRTKQNFDSVKVGNRKSHIKFKFLGAFNAFFSLKLKFSHFIYSCISKNFPFFTFNVSFALYLHFCACAVKIWPRFFVETFTIKNDIVLDDTQRQLNGLNLKN